MGKIKIANNMTEGNPLPLLLRFMLPLLAGNLMQQLYNVVDTIVVGNFLGDAALAAVGSGFPFIFVMLTLFIGLGIGAMIIVAQLFGQADYERLQLLLTTIYKVVLLVAIPMSILGFLLSKPILVLLQVSDLEVLQQGTIYLQIIFLGLVGMLGFNLNAGFLQGIGDSLSSLLFLVIATIINIILDLIFTLIIPWGVMGVAIATSIAQTSAWIFGIFYINRRYAFLHINLLKLKFDYELLKTSVRLGVPAAAHQMLYACSNLVLQAVINSNGKVFTAGFVTSNKVDTFAFLPILSMSTAITTYVGQNAGKGDLVRIKRGIACGLKLMFGMSFVIAWLVWLFRVPLLSIFNSETDVIQSGLYYLEETLPYYSLLGIMYGLNAVFQGVGQTMLPLISSAGSQFLGRLIIVAIIVNFFPIHYLYYAFPLSWVLGCLISIYYYFAGNWRERIQIT